MDVKSQQQQVEAYALAHNEMLEVRLTCNFNGRQTEGNYAELIIKDEDLMSIATKWAKIAKKYQQKNLKHIIIYITTTDELINAVDNPGHASSVDKIK